ncbi:SWI5-dependent HO expression protein 4 [Coemansia sp. RSA 988]|nr:SWI5-dependent HO expression protein 4 [Coemansia sp. RSA 988]
MARAPAISSTQQHQDRVARITKELQTDSAAAPKLLLERAQAYGDMGEESLARGDLAQAAALVKESRYKSAESVAAVEQAFRDLTVANGGAAQRVSSAESLQNQYKQNSNKELADLVIEAAAQHTWNNVARIVAEIGRRMTAKQVELDSKLFCTLLDAFHSACEQEGSDAHNAAKAVAASTGAAATKLAVTGTRQQTEAETAETQSEHASAIVLEAAAARVISVWDTHGGNSEFQQRAARYGSRLYAACAYALATYVGGSDGSNQNERGAATTQRKLYELYIGRVWLEATAATAAAEEASDATQGLLRILTADRALFAELFAAGSGVTEANGARPFERLLVQLGQDDTADSSARGMAMLVVSQLVAAAKGTTGGTRNNGPPVAIQQLRADAVRVLDKWIQSTQQAERTRGLRALAALYESGTGTELAADLWLQRGWAEELWDQGEWDGHDAQLALLRLADASSAHATVATQMKRLGSALVLKLARRKPGSAVDAVGDAVANAAAGVLAKWAGLPADAANNVGAAAQEGVAPETAEPTPEADPVELADQHLSHITAQATTGADAAAAMEPSIEALGYLCLRPSLKEHVVQNGAALAAIFACGHASGSAPFCFAAAMLVRNLTQPRAVLSDEQRRLQQLQRMGNRAQSAAATHTTAKQEKDDERERELDSPSLVARRAERVCAAGAIPMLVSAVSPTARPSDGLKDAVAEIFAALATVTPLRGLLVQQGAVQCLLRLLTPDAPKAAAAVAEPRPAPRPLSHPRDRNIAWALAKIGISVPPHLAFRHPREIVRLLLALAAEESDAQALLMRFEALLALTNLASATPGSPDDVRAYLAIDLAGFGLLESALLSSHPLVRRAATELVCNLVYDPTVFERFAAGADKCVPPDDAPSETLLPSGIVELPDDSDTQQLPPSDGDDAYRAQRLHLLVALSDVDDVATRSAAAGALAILSSDLRCARYLFLAHPRASAVFGDLATDDCGGNSSAQAGLRHRVAVICANAATCTDTRVAARIRCSPGLVASLRAMADDKNSPCAAPASRTVEILDGC